MSVSQPPLKGLAGVAVLDGVQLLNAGLRTAHRAGGVSRGTQNTIWNAPRRIRTSQPPSAPERGAAAAAAEGCGEWLRFCQDLGEFVQSGTNMLRTRLGYHEAISAYRETPQSAPLGLPAPLSGALFSLPPLGEVPRSGKGGAVGNFELLPFIEQHPLSLALLDSSPIGEPRASLPPLGVVRRTALAAPSGGSAAKRQRGCRW